MLGVTCMVTPHNLSIKYLCWCVISDCSISTQVRVQRVMIQVVIYWKWDLFLWACFCSESVLSICCAVSLSLFHCLHNGCSLYLYPLLGTLNPLTAEKGFYENPVEPAFSPYIGPSTAAMNALLSVLWAVGLAGPVLSPYIHSAITGLKSFSLAQLHLSASDAGR